MEVSWTQCSKYKKNWRCQNPVKEGTHLLKGIPVPFKLCEHHVAQSKSKRVRDAEKGKTAKPLSQAKKDAAKERRKQPYSKEARGLYYQTNKEVIAPKMAARAQIPKNKARRLEQEAMRRETPAYRLEVAVASKIRKMLRGRRSETVRKLTGWASAEDAMDHFKSTFVEGMTCKNYKEWQCGHRIARAMYGGNEEDDKRCWNPNNLFAQWASENNCMKVKLPPNDELLAIRHLWPVSWNDELPSIEKRKELERVAMRGCRAY